MNRYNQLLRAACTGLIAALMAGCAAYVVVCALGFEISWLAVYGVAAFAAAAVQLARRGTAWTIGISAALVLALGWMLAACGADIAAMLRQTAQGVRPDYAALPAAGYGIALISALLLGALFSGLLRVDSGASLALLVALAAMICALASNEDVSIWAALPGLTAGVAAFGLPGDSHKGGVRPVLLAPAMVLTLLAFVLVPVGRTTWAPLENLAAQVRSVVEDYIRFTEERIAFSINEKGYDHAGMVGDDVVAMLGGPANPDTAPVMTVNAGSDLLLRGTIRTAYTGYSWIDDTVKNRYLYYDITHSNVRDRVFGKAYGSDWSAFEEVEARIEMLADGTSTLFVPARLAEFSMDISNAVYYNSAGEMFMARPVEAGDKYTVTALNPIHSSGLADAVLAAMDEKDDRYNDILSDHSALPAGIDSRVYTLAVELTQGYMNPYDKADAIRRHLVSNYHYTLEPDYPPENRDFVSWFLLESKEGYCSSFASAMAVMCRIAGLPARYVEGYLARPDESGLVTLTGEDAHAWVEVYFKGLGWVSFDPSGGQHSGDDDGSGEDDHTGDETGMDIPDDELMPTPTPTPSPTPALHPDDEQGLDNFENDGTDPDPTPPLPPADEDPFDDPFDEPFEDPFDNFDGGEEEDPWGEKERNFGWLWILFGILLALLIAFVLYMLVKARLRNADPVYLSGRTRDAREAAMILYRANLTLLAHMGQAPLSGESPEAFAARLEGQFANTDFAAFAEGVSMSAYAGRPIDRETVMAGRRAYSAFLNAMRPMEKIRFTMTRLFRGLGNFESIP